MHTPEKTKQIKTMKAAKEETELSMGRVLYAFRNGWEVSAVELLNAQVAFEQFVTIAKEE